MAAPEFTLVCFAVKEERAPFATMFPESEKVRTLVTGIGRANTERRFGEALRGAKPGLVLSCGFAGGLNPALKRGDVVFEVNGNPGLAEALTRAGARAGIFYCSERIASTAREKEELRDKSGADAVEMESGCIQELCREGGVRCATVRVVLDEAGEDLPLDFNQLMNADKGMDYGKLMVQLAKTPGKIGGLMRLQKQTREAGGALAEVLRSFLEGWK